MWLIKNSTLREMRTAVRSGALSAAADRAQAFSAAAMPTTSAPRNLRIAGEVAEISVTGLLTPRPDFIAFLLGIGNTTYADIRSALALAANDTNVRKVSMVVDSPGGAVSGLFETLAALQAFTKPIAVRASCACSAAYAIAAAAGRIEAVTPASEFGSIGVAAAYLIDPDVVDIASTEAPNKRPDVSTEEGQAVVREELDAIHELFVEAIAAGRGTTVATVNAKFGRGGVLLAREAKAKGMIDALPGAPARRRVAVAPSSSEDIFAGDREREIAKWATLTPPRQEGEGELAYANRLIAMMRDALGEPAPRPRENASGGDLGDQVVAALDRRRTELPGGLYITDLMGHAPKPSAGPDLGDKVVAVIALATGKGTPEDAALVASLPPPPTPAAPSAEEGDLGDQVVRVLDGQFGKTQRTA